ncbi:hypothetical protein Hanom_Chr08g00697001 [Helianthus anomalus]
MVYRCGKWTKIAGTDLLPGDVVSVDRSRSCCWSRWRGKICPRRYAYSRRICYCKRGYPYRRVNSPMEGDIWIPILDGWIFEFVYVKENSKRFDRGVTVRCRLVYHSCSCHDVFIWNGRD